MLVNRDHFPDRIPVLIVRPVADFDLVVLRREPKAVDRGTGPGLGIGPAAGGRELAQRVRLVHSLFVVQFVLQVEIAPPKRLIFTPVPVEKLRQQPPPAFGRVFERRAVR